MEIKLFGIFFYFSIHKYTKTYSWTSLLLKASLIANVNISNRRIQTVLWFSYHFNSRLRVFCNYFFRHFYTDLLRSMYYEILWSILCESPWTCPSKYKQTLQDSEVSFRIVIKTMDDEKNTTYTFFLLNKSTTIHEQSSVKLNNTQFAPNTSLIICSLIFCNRAKKRFSTGFLIALII